MQFLLAVLELLDGTILAILSVPILAAFLGAFLLAAVFGLVLQLIAAAGGRTMRR